MLNLIGSWGDDAAGLAALVDGWEYLAQPDSLGAEAMRAFCEGRGAACAALANLVGCCGAQQQARLAGEGWALAELAMRLSEPGEREVAARLMAGHEWKRIAMPRALRPLAVLHGLAASAARKGPETQEHGPNALLLAMRIGLFGR